MKRPTRELHLCFDLGGTKIKAALVSATGRIVNEVSQQVDQSKGYQGLLKDFKSLADQLATGKFKSIAVASAGPLHPGRGELLDPTNFFTGGKSWGVLKLTAALKKVFKQNVYLENDAAAAALGEQWKGGHKKSDNLIAMTLGTGVGIGVIANGQLVRAGQGLHPEASHIPLNFEDKSHRCGCGAYGCIEAYVGGSHFTRKLGERLGRTLTGQEALLLANDGHPEALKAFRSYGEHLAYSIRTLSILFAAETVVLSGGFSHASPHFLQTTRAVLPDLMTRYREGVDLLPEVRISKLQDDAGILGAAAMAVQRIKKGR